MTTIRTRVSWLAAAEALAASGEASAGRPLRVLDVGGGVGVNAVKIAQMGHHVTVVDSSPDALATLGHRAHEARVTVDGIAGDAERLAAAVGVSQFDLVLCHGVIEHVESPAAVIDSCREVLRAGGVLSVVVPGRVAAVRERFRAGDVAGAHLLIEADVQQWDVAQLGPRSYLWAELPELLAGAGWQVLGVRGVRAFVDDAPAGLGANESDFVDAVVAAEAALRTDEGWASQSVGLQLLGRLD